nr:MAG TPA: protein of unknown function DUF1660 [Caudoviricetes sp.]
MTKYCIEILLVILVLVLIWVPGIVYLLTGHPKFIYHDILGWHEPDKNAKIWSDGCSSHCRCKHCGKEIMQDSQGNWFTFN